MFRIKVCGVADAGSAVAAAAAGADAIGLNFHPQSPRYVAHEAARAIVAQLPQHVARVGVFVDAPTSDIVRAASELRLDYVQLHGDEPAEIVVELRQRLGPCRVIKAHGLRADKQELVDLLAACHAFGALPDALLVDAFAPSERGGTGRRARWDLLAPPHDWLAGVPLILAGGLTPDNVAQSIAAVRPHAVDTASGVEVESRPGVKDPARTAAFVAAARAAFAAQ